MKKIKDKAPGKDSAVNQASYLEIKMTEYIPNGSVNAISLKKVKANIAIMTVPADETVVWKVISFHTFIQIIKGSAEVIILNEKHQLKLGDGIVIPDNTKYSINAKEKLIVLSTTGKSGYQDVCLN